MIAFKLEDNVRQSCKSGRAFRAGFGPKFDKNFGLNSGLRRTFFPWVFINIIKITWQHC